MIDPTLIQECFIEGVYHKLRRHPKRVVFPDGLDTRVIEAAARYVGLELGPAILLGNRERIESIAAERDVLLKRVMIIDPLMGEDVKVFAEIIRSMPRNRGMTEDEAIELLKNPYYFGSLMLRHGHCDALVGSASLPANILRPLFQVVRPLPGIKNVSSCLIMELKDSTASGNKVLFLADAGVILNPTSEQLVMIGLETAKLSLQITGERAKVAFLSFSSFGSSPAKDVERIREAIDLLKKRVEEEKLAIDVDGEMQVDVALDPYCAQEVAPMSPVAGRANVLIFPDLNSGNIGAKLVQCLASAKAYGQILTGLSKPAAEVSRNMSAEDIVGVASIVALQAIEFRRLYPELAMGDIPYEELTEVKWQ